MRQDYRSFGMCSHTHGCVPETRNRKDSHIEALALVPRENNVSRQTHLSESVINPKDSSYLAVTAKPTY